MDRPLRVFVSSTAEDLSEFRRAASEEILLAEWKPVLMQPFGGTGTATTIEECCRAVASCDLVLLLVAHRWGWVPDTAQGGDGRKSITAWEFEEAVARKIDVRAFLADEDWPGRLWEPVDDLRARVRTFRERLNRPARGFSYEKSPGAPGSSFRLAVREELIKHKEEIERRRREALAAPPAAAGGGASLPPPPAPPARTEIIDFRVERARHRGLCGRGDLLQRLEGWLADPTRPPSWIVVVGMPGVGKTALLAGCLDLLESRGHRVPHHFVRRHRGTWERPEAMARSLAAQVESMFPEHARPGVTPEDRLLEVLGLVSERELVPQGRHLYLVIDGLEELAEERGPEVAVRTYLPHALPPHVHVICSTRRHPPLLEWLQERGGVTFLDLDAQTASNRSACEEWWAQHARDFDPPLASALVKEAVVRAEGNLLYTVMLGEWLRSLPPAERRADRIPLGLAGFLRQAWRRVHEATPDARGTLVAGLALVCAARESLSLPVLTRVAGWERADEGRAFLDHTRTLLLEEPGPGPDSTLFRPFHESFRQFVLREGLSPAEVAAAHRALAERLAVWPLHPDASGPERLYALRHAIWHRLACDDVGAAVALVRDAAYLREACSAVGVTALEDAVQAVVSRAAGREDAAPLPVILRALRQESHWLRRDPGALAPILYNRLLCMGLVPGETVKFEGALSPDRFPRLRHALEVGSRPALRTLEGHAREVVALASLPGSRLASASLDGTVRVWGAADGRPLGSWLAPAPNGALCALTDGRLAVGLADGRVAVWSPDTAQEPRLVAAHERSVHTLVARDGGGFLSGGGDGSVRAWSSDSLRALAAWTVADPKDRPVLGIAPLAGGRFVASTGRGPSPRRWEADPTKGPMAFQACDAPVLCVATLPSGRVVGASANGGLHEWDPETGTILRAVPSPGDIVLCLLPLSDGRVACGLADGRIRVVDLGSGSASHVLRAHDRDCLALANLPDGTLASGSADHTVRIWDVTTERGPAEPFEAAHYPLAMCAVGPGQVGVVSTDRTVRIRDVKAGRLRVTLQGHEDRIQCIDRLKDGRIVTGAADGEIRVWEAEGRRCVGTFRHGRVNDDRRFAVNALAALRDGNLATGGADGDLRFWYGRGLPGTPAEAQPEESGTFWLGQVTAAHRGEVFALVVLRDGRLVSGGSDGRVLVWERLSGYVPRLVGSHDDEVRALAALPDGRLASGSSDRTIRLWDVKGEPRLARVLKGHEEWISGLVALPDGRIASASADRTVRIWDPASDRAPWVVHGPAYFLCVTREGDGIVAGDRNDAIWILDVPPVRSRSPDPDGAVPVGV